MSARSKKKRHPDEPRRCPSCARFCRWRTLRYERRTACCFTVLVVAGPLVRQVVEVVREVEICGERFMVAVTTGRLAS